MTINGEDVSLSEFEYIWNKNNSNQTADSTSLDEYIDMFVTFKLKVAAGKEAGLDTMESFKNELAGYRAQLTPQYLKDDQMEKALQEEAYQLMQTYVDASHILLPVKDDEKAVYQQAMEIRQAILNGASFEEMAKEHSADNSRNQGGYLGNTLSSRYIYPFAKAAVQLKDGEI
ncbi:MAG: peptidylprolyl isomerase, partial [Bacteroidales bacterium]|nr:peptidylprolyl isomerase [Bacteroidales bacterium]